MNTYTKIALGGGCHWCTEAVFQALKGVAKVEQGYVASVEENTSFSEAVIIHFNEAVIGLSVLIEIHLHTHKSTSNHSMRDKYRSAIYYFSEVQKKKATDILNGFKNTFEEEIITEVLPFSEFKASREAIQNYYKKNPEKPFCKQFINPKLKLLVNKFSKHLNKN
ncbi:peptide-methionine (S)-S-oxide reductase [Algibacter lectus]|uniref:peptide-methionine (S)-S-oxide reductase n=1 Tax=Algibacter lectus TaxID=221126 RepID=A0A090VA80_9FLAO|nr:peptide-methionine (S)-S-oxide reductase [Algibacter lectus]MWW24019.1 peptide methionine sulfoxide reductase [Algibacter lectus]TDY62035.1 peptide-methionine (S)-S-oxide reductase [Algibacter lectus]SFC80544.1 peptide-methionine (S)-S-oxide reductase [Algibacter lectus]GAL60988.1 peptide methionine sulfoxide reductase MsrA [Algibacter lectus]GAL78892.1 peptide methionine sulfoxide reductase MsrA [Algibacter lectus]